jgi:tetracycline 7-halogenase / FADH2 O2-dependent halogenase
MNTDFDIAVVGSGFGGSLTAMIARRLGRSVILLERGRHPRFAIGESSTPLANLLLEELARRYDLPRLLPLAKWGSWQKAYPQIACGLKRGFTFYHHEFEKPFLNDSERRDQLLVAASPRDEIADTHWYRADFDRFLVREAQALGVEYLDQTKLDIIRFNGRGVALAADRAGKRVSVRAQFIVDASGPRGFLHRALRLPEAPFEDFPPTQALYSHFTDVKRREDSASSLLMPSAAERPPYPVDDAAVHHVFAGGWVWILRFNNGITSAGVAATDGLADALRFAEGEEAWNRLLERLPGLREQFTDATSQRPFVHAPRLSFRSATVVGPRWALLPSAAGVVDPLLSTGFPLTLQGIARLAGILEAGLDSPRLEQRLNDYAQQTFQELDVAAKLVAALYASMNDFPLFTALSLLYFAAASFTETLRRLDRPDLAGSFLLNDHPDFSPRLHSCCDRCLRAFSHGGVTAASQASLIDDIYNAIEPFDVAGLCDRGRRNWHPVAARDLLNAAGKLGVSQAEIKQLLARCGFLEAENSSSAPIPPVALQGHTICDRLSW